MMLELSPELTLLRRLKRTSARQASNAASLALIAKAAASAERSTRNQKRGTAGCEVLVGNNIALHSNQGMTEHLYLADATGGLTKQFDRQIGNMALD